MNKINVLYICHAPDTLGGAALSLYNLIQSVADYVHPIVMTSKQSLAFDFFTSKGIECVNYPFLGGIRSDNFMRRCLRYMYKHTLYKMVIYKISNFIKRRSIRIIHSNSVAINVGYELSKKTQIKHVWHLREFLDLDFNMQPEYGWNELIRRVHKSDAAIAITKAVYYHFKLQEMNHSICLWDAIVSKYNIPSSQYKQNVLFHCAANLSPNKGTTNVVKCFVKSGLYRNGVNLLLGGNISAEYKSELYNNYITDDTKDSIKFIGYVSDIRNVLLTSKAFLMFSKNEGLGRVTIEAMACECPVIGIRSGGTEELLKDGNGILCDNEEECIAAMNDVFVSDYSDMIKRAKQFAINNFSIEEYGKNIMSIYNQILC